MHSHPRSRRTSSARHTQLSDRCTERRPLWTVTSSNRAESTQRDLYRVGSSELELEAFLAYREALGGRRSSIANRERKKCQQHRLGASSLERKPLLGCGAAASSIDQHSARRRRPLPNTSARRTTDCRGRAPRVSRLASASYDALRRLCSTRASIAADAIDDRRARATSPLASPERRAWASSVQRTAKLQHRCALSAMARRPRPRRSPSNDSSESARCMTKSRRRVAFDCRCCTPPSEPQKYAHRTRQTLKMRSASSEGSRSPRLSSKLSRLGVHADVTTESCVWTLSILGSASGPRREVQRASAPDLPAPHRPFEPLCRVLADRLQHPVAPVGEAERGSSRPATAACRGRHRRPPRPPPACSRRRRPRAARRAAARPRSSSS